MRLTHVLLTAVLVVSYPHPVVAESLCELGRRQNARGGSAKSIEVQLAILEGFREGWPEASDSVVESFLRETLRKMAINCPDVW